MWHLRIGSGVLIVTLQGMSANDITAPACPKPSLDVPREAQVVAPTGCEARRNWVVPEVFRFIAKTFLSEASSGALPIAFGAGTAERDEVDNVLDVLGIEKIGYRITESSAYLEGSLANATLT